jgi:hypothetical protein
VADSNLCSEGPVLEAKGSPAPKCSLEFTDVPCVASRTAAITATTDRPADSALHPKPAIRLLLLLTVLRI